MAKRKSVPVAPLSSASSVPEALDAANLRVTKLQELREATEQKLVTAKAALEGAVTKHGDEAADCLLAGKPESTLVLVREERRLAETRIFELESALRSLDGQLKTALAEQAKQGAAWERVQLHELVLRRIEAADVFDRAIANAERCAAYLVESAHEIAGNFSKDVSKVTSFERLLSAYRFRCALRHAGGALPHLLGLDNLSPREIAPLGWNERGAWNLHHPDAVARAPEIAGPQRWQPTIVKKPAPAAQPAASDDDDLEADKAALNEQLKEEDAAAVAAATARPAVDARAEHGVDYVEQLIGLAKVRRV